MKFIAHSIESGLLSFYERVAEDNIHKVVFCYNILSVGDEIS